MFYIRILSPPPFPEEKENPLKSHLSRVDVESELIVAVASLEQLLIEEIEHDLLIRLYVHRHLELVAVPWAAGRRMEIILRLDVAACSRRNSLGFDEPRRLSLSDCRLIFLLRRRLLLYVGVVALSFRLSKARNMKCRYVKVYFAPSDTL